MQKPYFHNFLLLHTFHIVPIDCFAFTNVLQVTNCFEYFLIYMNLMILGEPYINMPLICPLFPGLCNAQKKKKKVKKEEEAVALCIWPGDFPCKM